MSCSGDIVTTTQGLVWLQVELHGNGARISDQFGGHIVGMKTCDTKISARNTIEWMN